MSARTGNRPRRKAKQERSRETVDLVLEAAARVLLERGYAAATTNRIATAAGVSVGTVYEYFANKEEVFDALIEREVDVMLGAFRTQRSVLATRIDVALMQFIAAAMGAMRFGPDLIRALEQVPGARFRSRLVTGRSEVVAIIHEFLEERRDQLRVVDVELAALLVVSAVEGIAANVPAERFDESLAREVTSLVMLYLAGAETSPGSATES